MACRLGISYQPSIHKRFINPPRSPFQVLANYLLHSNTLPKQSILELGSGTGLVGLLAGLVQRADSTSTVYITDQTPMLALMRQNIALNNLEDNVTALQLD